MLCGVPLLDMVRYHLYGSGKTWISEYGSADDAEQFKSLSAHSPYHHVKPGTHSPPTLVLSADSDDRVDPMHARKFAAALQASSTGGPVLLRIEKNSGHGGADLIRSTIQMTAGDQDPAVRAGRDLGENARSTVRQALEPVLLHAVGVEGAHAASPGHLDDRGRGDMSNNPYGVPRLKAGAEGSPGIGPTAPIRPAPPRRGASAYFLSKRQGPPERARALAPKPPFIDR